MSQKKVIVVTGATGAQGGSVVQHLLRSNEFSVRAVTRKPSSPEAEALKKLGCEVVQGDAEHVDSLKAAFHGAYGAFLLTQFWEHFHKETQHGINMAEAAKAAGLKHVVYSTLEHSFVPHFESKARVSDHIRNIGLPATHLLTAFYFENVLSPKLMGPKKVGDELQWHIAIPHTSQIFAYSVADTGAFVLEALRNPGQWLGREMRVVAEFITPKHMEETLIKVTGKKLSVISVDMEQFRHSGAPGAEELYLNLKWFHEHPASSGIRDLEQTKAIYPKVHNFESFLRENEGLWKNL